MRCAEALESRKNWVSVVLTFAQKDWSNPFDQYTKGGELWACLRKRIVREYGATAYLQTWERHKKGGAHVNVCLSNPRIFHQVAADFRPWKNGWLEPHAVECGFGFRCWVEPVVGKRGMAGYLTKLSRELTGASAKGQTPFDAPPHFRRLRASRGLLPPIRKGDLTGALIRCSLQRWTELHPKGDQ